MKKIELGECELGKGVFACEDIAFGEWIIDFTGPVIGRSELPEILRQEEDFYQQIDENHFVGPSGGLDDYINHSCSPNAGLIISSPLCRLIAIGPIRTGDQICFDYSTAMLGGILTMECRCGTENCRGIVDDFNALPWEVKQRYLELGIIPDFVKRNAQIRASD